MKNRIASFSLGLLAVLGALACGGDEINPPEPQVPGAPSGVSATPGDAQANVSWSAPTDDGGSTIQEYVVRVIQGGAVARTQRSPVTSVTVTGLTNGMAYSFSVAAVNAVGEGPPSASSADVVPRVVPGAPRNVSVTPGNTQVSVTWEAPADLGMPITGYTVTVREGERVVATQAEPGLSATVSGLDNGTTYQVQVSAANAVVAGPSSDPVSVTPRSVPLAPVVTFDSGGNMLAIFEWTEPDDQGSPITGYVVTLRTQDTVVRTLETTARRLVITELTNGTEYLVTVQAINALGVGAASASASVTPCGPPAAPTDVLVTRGSGELQMQWTPPADTGGCPLMGYRLSSTVDGTYREWHTTETSYTVTGLQNGVQYEFTLVAGNALPLPRSNYGSSVTIFGIPRGVPDAPPSFTAQPLDGAVNLTWMLPNTRGSILRSFRVTVEPGELPAYNVAASTTSLRVEGLTNGTAYTFTIVAVSNVGDSAPSTTQATPAAP